MNRFLLFISGLIIVRLSSSFACTSYLVSSGASKDGSCMISYAGDSHVRYGQLYFYPRAKWSAGEMQNIYDRSSGKLLGQIPYPAETYQVIGFMNEFQVSIGESTFGGRSELSDKLGILDWGSIMFATLQRSKTAREAVKNMVILLNTYGYYSAGQSYSIADKNEVWIVELIGKGENLKLDKKSGKNINLNKGVVFVARRVPDGYISAHANHSRITNFPLEDGRISITDKNLDKINNPDIEVVYSHDIIDFARKMKFFEGNDADFSFSQAYAPLDFGAARFCDLRVWAMFNQVSDDMQKYWEYATGNSKEPRIPLFIKPNRKLSPRDLMEFKANYLQGTELDMSKDIGAGPHGLPYRWRPLTWKYEGKEYFHERVTATQQTAFSWVAQCRKWLPDAIGGIFWYGLDDANLSVHVPFYCGMTNVPYSYSGKAADLLTYSDNSAFWVFNRVSHFVYLFYDRAIVDLRKEQSRIRDKFEAFIPAIDAGAKILYDKDPVKASEFLTDFSHNSAENTLNDWKQLGNFLLVKYLDGNVKKESNGEFERNEWGFPASPTNPEYPDKWKETLIEETGEKFIYKK